MRNCPGPLPNPTADQDLFLLSRGELPARRRAPLALHLLTCSACRARVREFRQLTHLLAASLGSGPMPRGRLGPSVPTGLIVATVLFSGLAVWSAQASGFLSLSSPPRHAPGAGEGTCASVAKAIPVPMKQGTAAAHREQMYHLYPVKHAVAAALEPPAGK